MQLEADLRAIEEKTATMGKNLTSVFMFIAALRGPYIRLFQIYVLK